MKKLYLSAPLPFVGQKRNFAKEFIKVLEQYPDGTTFVDLFGGSGLLSHIAKYYKPHSKVVYNDYDNYRQRLQHIMHTNELLEELRAIVGHTKRNSIISGRMREEVFDALRRHEEKHGYIDCVTLSTSLLFSMKYKTSIDGLDKETLYNKVRRANYDLCNDYLDGLTIASEDFTTLFNRYKDVSNVVFFVDPPYLSTDVGTYTMNWKLSDYLNVLTVLSGQRFVYFTSNKSSIVELCKWLGNNPQLGNPFAGCEKVELNRQVNYSSKYTDIMLYNIV